MGDNIPRDAGEFALGSDDLSSSTNVIQINLTDLGGTTIGLGDVDVGDYIEIVDVGTPSNYVLFVVSSKPNGTGIADIGVTLKEKGNNFLINATCEIRFFELNDQDVQLDDLDSRYLQKTGGDMSGTINMRTNPILGVQYLGLTGAKCIQEAQTTRIKFENKVVVTKVGLNKAGFVIKGATANGADTDLLSVYHNDTGGLDAVNYQGKQDSETNIATVGYVDSVVGGGSITHTLLGKGMWAKAVDEIATDTFIGFDYNGNTRNNLDQYTMGIAISSRYSNQYTDELEWKEGAYVEVYDNSGNLIFCEEINSVEHDTNGYLRLHWEYMPTMYIAQTRKYGDLLMLKVTGLTGTSRMIAGSRNSPIPPPSDDPDIGK